MKMTRQEARKKLFDFLHADWLSWTPDSVDVLQMAIDALVRDKNAPSKTFTVIDLKTGEEADPYEIALHEDWAKHLMYCDMEGFAIEEDGSLILVDECGRYEYCPVGRFEVRWDEG